MSESSESPGERLIRIERDLHEGRYRPGPWAALVRELRRRPLTERRALAPDVTRLSDALHRRRVQATTSVFAGVTLEMLVAGVGLTTLVAGMAWSSNLFAATGALLLAAVAQPLVKVAVGLLLGIRYSYAYLLGAEPRFKMRFGSYLACPGWARVVYHLAGTVGTPLTLALVALCDGVPPATRAICGVLALAFASVNLAFFAAAAAGRTRIGGLRLAITSGGSAGLELRGG